MENVDAAVAWQRVIFFSSFDCVSLLFCHPGAIAVAWRGINNRTDQFWQRLGSDKIYYHQCGRQCVSSEIHRYCTVDYEGVGFRFPFYLVNAFVYKLYEWLGEWRTVCAIAHNRYFCSCRDWWKIISISSHFPGWNRHLLSTCKHCFITNGTEYKSNCNIVRWLAMVCRLKAFENTRNPEMLVLKTFNTGHWHLLIRKIFTVGIQKSVCPLLCT